MNEKIKKAIIEKPYIYLFGLFIILYLAFLFYVTRLDLILSIFNTYPLWVKIVMPTSIILSTLLVALVINLTIMRIKEGRKLGVSSGGGFFASFLGIISGGCPHCATTILPAILSFFGLSLSFVTWPLGGFEFQFVVIGLLGLSVYNLSKPVVCEVPNKKA